MHFPEVEGLRDVVIIQLQVIFDRITSLITSQFTFEEIGHAAVVSDFSDSGTFTEKTLRKLSTRKGDPLTPTRIVSLLQCLHIVAQMKIKGKKRKSEKCYFMPCALKPFVLGTASGAHNIISELCPPPLPAQLTDGSTVALVPDGQSVGNKFIRAVSSTLSSKVTLEITNSLFEPTILQFSIYNC